MASLLAGRPILIVEDEPLIALEVAHSFEVTGAHVVTAFSLGQALELAERHDWAGAVLDYWLDGQDCSELCELLLKRSIPFVICTGLDEVTGPAAKGVQIAKPANSEDIVRITERLAARQHQAA